MLALDPDTLISVAPKRGLWMAAKTCSVSYGNELTPERLEAALVSGIVAPGDEATFLRFVDEAPLNALTIETRSLIAYSNSCIQFRAERKTT